MPGAIPSTLGKIAWLGRRRRSSSSSGRFHNLTGIRRRARDPRPQNLHRPRHLTELFPINAARPRRGRRSPQPIHGRLSRQDLDQRHLRVPILQHHGPVVGAFGDVDVFEQRPDAEAEDAGGEVFPRGAEGAGAAAPAVGADGDGGEEIPAGPGPFAARGEFVGEPDGAGEVFGGRVDAHVAVTARVGRTGVFRI